MSDESDGEDSNKVRHSPAWRSQSKLIISVTLSKFLNYFNAGLSDFLHRLDERVTRNLGALSSRCNPRECGSPKEVAPPPLPQWMVAGSIQPAEGHFHGVAEDF